MEMIEKIPSLEEWYDLGGKPEIYVENNNLGDSGYEYSIDAITLTKPAFRSNYQLLGTLYHESYHAFQSTYKMTNGQTIRSFAQQNFGSINESGRGRFYLEMQAYNFEILMGSTNSQTKGNYNSYKTKFQNYGKYIIPLQIRTVV